MAVTSLSGRRVLEHSGEVSGFTAENIVLPDDGFAVVVLTNQDAHRRRVANRARQSPIGFCSAKICRTRKQDALIRKVFDGLKQGTIDRACSPTTPMFTSQRRP